MKNSIVVVAVLLGSSLSLAGAISGGGGKGVVCRDPGGAIISAETLDIYEARVLYGNKVSSSADPLDTQIQRALNVIPADAPKWGLRGLVSFYVNSVQKGLRIVHGTELEPVDDALIVVLPKNCKAEQLANYFNDNLILVDGDIWDKMDTTNQAALVLHEAIYAVARLGGAKDSMRSRHVVGSLFDPTTSWTDLEANVSADALTCTSLPGGNLFWAFKNNSGAWVLQFALLGGDYVMSKKSVEFSDTDLDFNEAKTFPVLPGEDKIGLHFGTGGLTRSAFEDNDWVAIDKVWEPLKDSQGQVVKGYQTPKYYISWQSWTYPNHSMMKQPLNCSVVFP